eukprot:2751979-Rhodomonas_salina.1
MTNKAEGKPGREELEGEREVKEGSVEDFIEDGPVKDSLDRVIRAEQREKYRQGASGWGLEVRFGNGPMGGRWPLQPR